MTEYFDCRNPVLPVELHIPDPEAHVMPDGRVYVYGSWDQEENIFCSKEYRVISSQNMVDWTDHGKSFDSSQVSWVFDDNAPKYPGVDWSKPTPFLQKMFAQAQNDKNFEIPKFPKDMLFAPDAIHRNGKYYLYFCLSDSSEGVAISDQPAGPFGNAVQLPCGGIDPAIFVDDDGQAYFYWGQFSASGVKLKDNMVEFVEGSIVNNLATEEDHFFHEGSSVRKRGDIYYFVYSSIVRGKPTSLAYATSRSPLGPFQYQGIIIDNDGCDSQSWNNHGSIEEVNGQWYVFYHRSSQNRQQKRRLCIEPIFFDQDGLIPEVSMTSQGAGRPFGLGERIDAWRACHLSGSVFIGAPVNAGQRLTGIQNGDSAVFRYVEWEAPAENVKIEAEGSGTIDVCLVDEAAPVGRIQIKDGMTISSSFHGLPGRHEVKLKFENANNLEIYAFTFS